MAAWAKPHLTKEDVLRKAAELGVRFVRLQFTDILGIVKNVAIPIRELEHALDGKVMFDGSSIEGFVRIEESDMYLRPDPDSFVVFPWTKGEETIARLICDVYNPDGTPFSGCPRGVLKRAVAEAAELGYEFYTGTEAEFFLFPKDQDGRIIPVTHDQGGYFDFPPTDLGEHARRDMVIALEEMGYEVEASHHETAPGQHEIDFRYSDAVTTSDNVSTFKLVVKTIATQHGLHATFMPKPVFGINGSGMHTHQSLFKGGVNAFEDPHGKYQMSETALQYMGGLLKHARSFAAVTNPLVNSYKRLVPGYEAPVYIAWSERNRSPMIRIPAVRGAGTRLELRFPDPSCNPYLAMAVMLKAGLDGIKHKVDPGAPTNQNIYKMTREERDKLGIRSLPANLGEALNELEQSPLMREALGEHIFEHFIEAKRMEWEVFNSQIHDWEIDQYMRIF